MGFVAGTLVHTDKGLVPIEQLKVGDLVLSRPENTPNAPNEYKQVLGTFKSGEKKPIVKVTFSYEDKQMHLFCTPDHPFWAFSILTDWSWQAAINFKYLDFDLYSKNNKMHNVESDTSYLIQTSDLDIAFVEDYLRNRYLGLGDVYIDFRQQKSVLIADNKGLGYPYNIRNSHRWHQQVEKTILPDDFNAPEMVFFKAMREETRKYYDTDSIVPDADDVEQMDRAYKLTVYNIKVADFHTYYVGHAGVWVHDIGVIE